MVDYFKCYISYLDSFIMIKESKYFYRFGYVFKNCQRLNIFFFL